MITVVIKNNDEPNVIQLTYENLWKELKDINGSEMFIEKHWVDAVKKVKNKFICFVESDCLVSEGYFSKLLDVFDGNPHYQKLSMVSASVGVNAWDNKFYGYSLGNNYTNRIVPNTKRKNSSHYAVQVGYVPGSVMRTFSLKDVLDKNKFAKKTEDNLVDFSVKLSLGFWNREDCRIQINTKPTYITTEEYVNDTSDYEDSANLTKLKKMFAREEI
jgi:hypothetical protein